VKTYEAIENIHIYRRSIPLEGEGAFGYFLEYAVCEGRLLDKLEAAATLVGQRAAGYRAAAPQGEGLSAFAQLA